MSRGHRVNNTRWEPRVGHDAAECLWRSVLYRVGVTAGIIAFVVIVFAARRDWYFAYAEAVVPTACLAWCLVEYHRFQRRSGQAVGVFVGWGAGIPSDDPHYLEWCQKHQLTPYPFAKSTD